MRAVLIGACILCLFLAPGCNKRGANAQQAARQQMGTAAGEEAATKATVQVGTVTSTQLSDTGMTVNLRHMSLGDTSASLIAYDADGNCILAGTSIHTDTRNKQQAAKTYNIAVIKLDPQGKQLWRRDWNANRLAEAWSMTLDRSQNILIGGTLKDTPGSIWGPDGKLKDWKELNYDFLLLKYSPEGELRWQRAWGGHEGGIVEALATDDSGAVFASGVSADPGHKSQGHSVLVKFGSDGQKLAEVSIAKLYGCTVKAVAAQGNRLYAAAFYLLNAPDRDEALATAFVPDYGLLLCLDSDLHLVWGRSMEDLPGTRPDFVACCGDGSVLFECEHSRTDDKVSEDILILRTDQEGGLADSAIYSRALMWTQKHALLTGQDALWMCSTADKATGEGSTQALLKIDAADLRATPQAYQLEWKDVLDEMNIVDDIALSPAGQLDILCRHEQRSSATWQAYDLKVADFTVQLSDTDVQIEPWTGGTYEPESTPDKN